MVYKEFSSFSLREIWDTIPENTSIGDEQIDELSISHRCDEQTENADS
jgi:hypothetical protein